MIPTACRRPAHFGLLAFLALLLAPTLAPAQLISFPKQELTDYTAQNPFDRLPDGRPKVPDELIERARGLSAEEVWAVLQEKGYNNQYADGFQVLHPGKTMVGRAFTVQFMPLRSDVEDVTKAKAKEHGLSKLTNQTAIDMLQPGDVLIVDLFGKKVNGTIVGDNLFFYVMKATHSGGLVVDGSIRDLDGISEIDMPAYFRAVDPTPIGNVMLTGINVPVRIGGVTVMPGDESDGCEPDVSPFEIAQQSWHTFDLAYNESHKQDWLAERDHVEQLAVPYEPKNMIDLNWKIIFLAEINREKYAAQIETLRSGDWRSHPAFWAAYFTVGNY